MGIKRCDGIFLEDQARFQLFSALGEHFIELCGHAGGRPAPDDALRRSVYFWEAAARNAFSLGVLGTLIGFVILICSESAVIPKIISGFADAVLSTFYGLVLVALFSLISFRIRTRLEENNEVKASAGISHLESQGKGLPWEHVLGYGLFAALLLLAIFSIEPGKVYSPIQWFFRLPSILIVAGGGALLALFVRRPVGSNLTMGFVLTGTISSFFGLIQIVCGFSGGSIKDVAAAVTFIISSCFVALVCMLFIGLPLEDRAELKLGKKKKRPLRRLAWHILPALVFLYLVLSFVIAITPIKKP